MEYEKDFSNQMMTDDSEMDKPDKDDIKSKATVKIKVPKGKGTGFFIKLERNKKPFYCLMTNQHVIKPEMIQDKEIISIYDNREILIKEIKLNPKERQIINFFEKLEDDIIIIEITPKDNLINSSYFLLPYINEDDNYNYNPYKYIKQSIKIIQYPEGGEQLLSKGKICGIYPDNEHIFIHNCNTKKGSSGGAIFLSGDQRVFGIHKGVYNVIKDNAGIFIEPIIKYLKNHKRNGEGTEYYENGQTKFVGEFLDDEYNGEGIFYYPNRNHHYIGQFLNGKKNGNGYEYYSNGEVYEGQFKNGLKNGYGCIKKNNIKIKEGLFINDQFIGDVNNNQHSSFINNNNPINHNSINNNPINNNVLNNNPINNNSLNNNNMEMNNFYHNNMNNNMNNNNYMNNNPNNFLNNYINNNNINNIPYNNINNNIYNNNDSFNNNNIFNNNNNNQHFNSQNNHNNNSDFNDIDNLNNNNKNKDGFSQFCQGLYILGSLFKGKCQDCNHGVESHEIYKDNIWFCKVCSKYCEALF